MPSSLLSLLATSASGGFADFNPSSLLPLRAAAVNNKQHEELLSNAGMNEYAFRTGIVIAQDCARLVLSLNNWYHNPFQSQGSGNAYSVVDMSLEANSDNSITPVYFDAARTKTLANGDSDIQCDAILPSALGLSKFSKGEVYWLKGRLTVPSNGNNIPSPRRLPREGDDFNTLGVDECQTFYYDSGATTLSSTDTAGVYVQTGGSPVNQNYMYSPLILGNPLIDQPSYLVVGDSITDGSDDALGGAGLYGRGYWQRLSTLADGEVPSINMSAGGFKASQFIDGTHTHWRPFLAYANRFFDATGRNDILDDGVATYATVRDNITALWAIAEANENIQYIIRPKLLVDTSSTDSWATTGNQTKSIGWTDGGVADQIDAYFDAQKTAGTIDYVITTDSIKDTGDSNLWKVDGTANFMTDDGTHPSEAGHLLYADDVLAGLRAFEVELGGVTPSYDILTTPGLYFYLDMNDAASITTSGAEVTDIQDQHTSNRDFQPDGAGVRPETGVTVGSLEAFDFDGADNIRRSGFGTPSNFAIITLMEFDPANAKSTVMSLMGDGANHILLADEGSTSTTISSGFGTPSFAIDGAVQSWSSRGDVYTALQSAGACVLTVSSITWSAFSNCYIGSQSGGVNGIMGKIAAIVGLDMSVADAADITAVENELLRQAGI